MILAALACFRRWGVAGTTIDAIADEAGVARPLVEDPGLIPGAVEEILRRMPDLTVTGPVVREPSNVFHWLRGMPGLLHGFPPRLWWLTASAPSG